MDISCLAHPINLQIWFILNEYICVSVESFLFWEFKNHFFIPSDSDTVFYSLHFEINKQTNIYNIYTEFSGPLSAFQYASGILVKFPGSNYTWLEYNSFEVI